MHDKKNIDKFPDTAYITMEGQGFDIELWKAVLRRYKEIIKHCHTFDKNWNPKISEIIFDLFRHLEFGGDNVADEMFKQLCIDHKDLKEYHAWDSDGAHYTKEKYEFDYDREDGFYNSHYHYYKTHRIWHIYEQEEKSIEYLKNKIKSKEIQHENGGFVTRKIREESRNNYPQRKK